MLPLAIDKDSLVPIYSQLQLGIKALIEAGSLQPGDGLPSENALSRQFSVSPMTIRQAMSELVRDGYIVRERGRGTFVAARHMEHPLDQLVSFSEDMRARNLHPASRIILLEQTTAPLEVTLHIGLPADTPMTRLKRVRLAENIPVGIHDSYLYSVDVTEAELQQTQSLYEVLQKKNIVLREGEDTIKAVEATPDAAQLLKVKAGSPLLCTTRFSWDSQGRFVEYVVALYRAELYQYRIRLKRG
ncbi:MAG: GntR family transcriptional regulator [Anaerolineae bacterium]|nr:GntR family transcriptional regulator [Anaerolineae bacterium]